MIGILGHVPGGAGAFEAVMLAGRPTAPSAPQVPAQLLPFPIICFLLPSCVALSVFGSGEFPAHRRSSIDCKTVMPSTGKAALVNPSLMDRAALPLPLQRKDEDMKSMNLAAIGTAIILGTGVAGMATAETENSDAAEMQQFLGFPQSLSQAIAAAETAAGGKAMDAGWELSDASTGGFHVEVVKPDGTMVDVMVSADGSTAIMAEAKDDDEGEGGDQDLSLIHISEPTRPY